jgi:tetratricopeptide (TPR) repeat protein
MSRLAQVGLRVAARTSAFAVKSQNLDAQSIARKLNVEAVIEGSIRREKDVIVVSYSLVDGRDGNVLWSDQVKKEGSSLLAIQDEISSTIVDKLKLKINKNMKKSAASTRSVAAQELYFKGLQAMHEGTDTQLRAALAFFEQAVAADSTYDLAYAGIAKTYAVLPMFGDYDLFEALTKGKQAAARATQLSPELGEAYAALGQISQNLEWDMTTALQNYRNALRASPNDATAHQWYSEALMMTGDLQGAITEITRALELDPLSAPAKNLRAYQSLLRGDNAASLRLYQTLGREHPKFTFGHLNAAFASLAAKEYGDAAGALVAAFPQFGPDVGIYVAAASGAGDKAAARRIVQSLEQGQRPSVAALLYAAIGDREKAVDLLEQSYRTASDATLPYWLLHPLLDPLRSDKRFNEITRGVGVVRSS